jgi:hypothetical protein
MSDTYENDFYDDPDPAHGTAAFYDASNTPDDFQPSPHSRFGGVHFDQVSGVARYLGGAGFSGDRQPGEPQ